MIEIKEIKAKSIINKSKILDYAINPFIGCSFACKYCYAECLTKKWFKIDKEWGTYVYVKNNAIELLKKQIKKIKNANIYLSPLTDPYLPIESKYEITKKIVEILLNKNLNVFIQTKSKLVLRDVEIFKKHKENVWVGVSISTLNSKIAKEIEPFAPLPNERIKVLEELKKENIKNFLFYAPIFPKTSINEIIDVIEKTKDFVDFYFFDSLHLYSNVKERFGIKSYDISYYKNLKTELEKYLNENKLKYQILF